MSREGVWKQFGYFIGSARNPEHDKRKGVRNTKCVSCHHIHGLNSVCRLKMTSHDKKTNEFRYYKCDCDAPQEMEQVA